MPLLHFRLAAACAMAAMTTAAAAQTPARTDDARVREIYVSAVDRKGQPVKDLTPADVVVREDGTAREVLSVAPAEAPLQIALLVDDSAALGDSTVRLREAIAAFLERLHGKAEIALITFGDRPTVLAPYTKDTSALQQRASRIFPRASAGAYLVDAIAEASRGLAKRDAERPTIVAVTFEGVSYGNLNYQQVLDELRKSGAALHVITVGTPGESFSDEARNRNMVIAEGTERTGGRRDQVLAASGLPERLTQLAEELANQYVVRYARPDTLIPPDRIQVSSPRPGVTLRARTRATER